MYWMVRLDDEHGCFWMESGKGKWSDSMEDGYRFTTEGSARLAAEQAKTSAANRLDWFPRIKVVRFK